MTGRKVCSHEGTDLRDCMIVARCIDYRWLRKQPRAIELEHMLYLISLGC